MQGQYLIIGSSFVIALIIVIVIVHFVKNAEMKYYRSKVKNLEIQRNMVASTPVLVELSKVEPIIKNDKMEEKYNWSGEIMFDDDYMESVMKSIKDVDSFLDDIEELEKLELSQVEDFINTPSGEEIEDAFKNLILLEEESEQDSISRYIVNRTDITRKLVNVYFNFEEFEYLFKLIEDYMNDECTLDNENGDDVDEH